MLSARLMRVALAAIALLASTAGASFADHPGGANLTPPALKQSIPQAPVFRDFLPPAVDLSAYMPPVGDQGDQGSCVGWATAYAARAYYAEIVEHRDTTAPVNEPSPAFVYDLIRQGDDCDGGSRIPDAMAVLQQGAYSLADFPYSDKSCARPASEKVAGASDFKIDSYEQVYDAQTSPDLDKVKGALARGAPVVSLVILDRAFQHLSPDNAVWVSDENQPSGGGHAITLVGYDDRSGTFKFINSWGTAWGDAGYAYMTYDTFLARAAEAYVMNLPGDPEVTLSQADLNPAPVVVPPPQKKSGPLIAITTLRDLAPSDETPVDVGALSCGKVDITTDAKGNRIASGFVGTQADLDRLTDLLKDKVDENDIALAPWPACEVRLTLAAALSDTDVPQVAVDPTAPHVDDTLSIGIRSPGFASYVYAAFIGADGTVTNLSQPDAGALKARPPHTALSFGGDAAGGTQLKVSSPTGDEMLVVLAAEKPLFDKALPASVSDRTFLSALRVALDGGDTGRVTATLVPVTTSP